MAGRALGADQYRSGVAQGDAGSLEPVVAPRPAGGRTDGDPEFLGRLEAIAGGRGQRSHGGLGQRGRDGGRDLGQRRRRLVDVPEHDGERAAVLPVRELPREQLEEHDPDRVHVGGRSEVGTAGLLGSHVGGGAQELTTRAGQDVVPAEHMGNPEVGHLERMVGTEEHVLRFDVAVEDSVLMGAVQARAHGQRDGAGRRLIESLIDEMLPDRTPGQPFHDQDAGVVVLHVVVDGNHVGMVDRGQDPRFGQEAGPYRLVAHERGRQLLDRHLPTELAMASGHHDAEPSASELVADLVPRQSSAQRAVALHQAPLR